MAMKYGTALCRFRLLLRAPNASQDFGTGSGAFLGLRQAIINTFQDAVASPVTAEGSINDTAKSTRR